MDKVYLVRYGCYSSQGIAGAFSTKGAAEKYCEVQNEIEDGYEDYYVDEIIVDLHKISPEAKVVTYYVTRIYLVDDVDTDGSIIVKKGSIDPYVSGWTEKAVYTRDVEINKNDTYIEVMSVKGQEHAEKVAMEQYQMHTQQEMGV